MFTLLGGNEKKAKKEVAKKDTAHDNGIKEARELFNIGRFPVVTTQIIENRPIAKVLGLVCCRGFDSDEAFFGMSAMAVKKGAQGIIGYNENIAFHPDGSKYFSCFGTAVMFQRIGRSDLLADTRTIKDTLDMIPNAPAPGQNYMADTAARMDAADTLTMRSNTTAKAVENLATRNLNTERVQLNSAQIAAQLVEEERVADPVRKAQQVLQKPSEEEDPVLQRLLANQKRQAPQSWQQ